jgi:hypothetical protein
MGYANQYWVHLKTSTELYVEDASVTKTTQYSQLDDADQLAR